MLSNSVKFTPNKGRIEIALRNRGDHAELVFRDTGAGIPADVLPYVFDRFRQADSTSSRLHGGLGLGLALVRHLTEMHGGTVTVSSDGPGKGATFTILLPALDRAQSPSAQERVFSPNHPAA